METRYCSHPECDRLATSLARIGDIPIPSGEFDLEILVELCAYHRVTDLPPGPTIRTVTKLVRR